MYLKLISIICPVFLLLKTLPCKRYDIFPVKDGREDVCAMPSTPPFDGENVTFDKADITSDIKINDELKLRVGYVEVFETFVYKGCLSKVATSSSFQLATKDLGICHTRCKTETFGMMENICYCNIDITRVTHCDKSVHEPGECDRPEGTPCGQKHTTVAVYTLEHEGNASNRDNNEDDDKLCLALKIKNRDVKKYVWYNCGEDISIKCLCQSVKQITRKTNNVYHKSYNVINTWQDCAEHCYEKVHYPSEAILLENFKAEQSGKYWTGVIRTKVVKTLSKDVDEKIPGYRKGFLTYEHGRFQLCFDENETINYVLCDVESTMATVTPTMTESEKTTATKMPSVTTTMFEEQNTRSLSTTESKTVEKQTDVTKSIMITTTVEPGHKFTIMETKPVSEFPPNCTLGSPEIYEDGTHVYIDHHDIQNHELIKEGFLMWIGYIKVLKSFIYKGCTKPTGSTKNFRLVKKDLGECYNQCHLQFKSSFHQFGMAGNQCHCFTNINDVKPFEKCGDNSSCDRPRGVSCGNHRRKIAVYKAVNEDNRNHTRGERKDQAKLCLAAKGDKNSVVQYAWKKCEHANLPRICQSGDAYKWIESSGDDWQTAMDKCFDGNNHPPDNNFDGKKYTKYHWTSEIRGNVIRKSRNVTFDKAPDVQQGYVVYKKGYFKIKFDDKTKKEIRLALCLYNSGIQESNDTSAGGKDSGRPYAVLIILPILLIIIIALSIALFVTKRRNASKTKSESGPVFVNNGEPSSGNIALNTVEEEEETYQMIRPDSEYAEISDSELNRIKNLKDNSEEKPSLPDRVYDKLQIDNNVYNTLNEKPILNTGTYNTFNEVKASTSRTCGKILVTNTYESLDMNYSKEDTYNTVEGVDNTKATKFEAADETIGAEQGKYFILEKQTVGDMSPAKKEMMVSNPGDNDIIDKQTKHEATDEQNADTSSTPGEYYILEKLSNSDVTNVQNKENFSNAEEPKIEDNQKMTVEYESHELETDLSQGEYFILEKEA